MMSGTSTSGKPRTFLEEGPSSTLMQRFLNNIFPKVPDFFGLLNDQCEILVQTMDALVAFMEQGDENKGLLIRELEKRGDEVKARNFAILAKAFATPLDREDIYRAITSIDEPINYAKTTVREMESLQLKPDAQMQEMARLIKGGADALCRGFAKLSFDPLGAVEDERAVHRAEHDLETCYRQALVALFDAPLTGSQEEGAEARLMAQTVEMFKHRELYRHLSNMGDHMSKAGTVLYDIMVQV